MQQSHGIRRVGCERRAEVGLGLGRSAQVAPEGAPLDEQLGGHGKGRDPDVEGGDRCLGLPRQLEEVRQAKVHLDLPGRVAEQLPQYQNRAKPSALSLQLADPVESTRRGQRQIKGIGPKRRALIGGLAAEVPLEGRRVESQRGVVPARAGAASV